MIVSAKYYFNDTYNGLIETEYRDILQEIYFAIGIIDAEKHKTKEGQEKTNTGKCLYSPSLLNQSFKDQLHENDWFPYKINCCYPKNFYTTEYLSKYNYIPKFRQASREIDFVKDNLGLEVQFGKYAFMAYDILGKMVVLHNMGIIKAGIEVVPVRHMTQSMSTGVSYFEQIVWDLENRGVSNLDIPVLIIGVDS